MAVTFAYAVVNSGYVNTLSYMRKITIFIGIHHFVINHITELR